MLAVIAAVVGGPSGDVGAQIPPPGLPNPRGDFDGDTITNEVECGGAQSNFLLNGSFETPAIPSGAVRTFVPSPTFVWQTTASDGQVELWNNHADGGSVPTPLPAADGAQIAELNASEPSALYQDVTTDPGEVYVWALAHRGRSGVDTMVLKIGPPSGPQVVATISDGNAAWGSARGCLCHPGRPDGHPLPVRGDSDGQRQSQHRQLPGCRGLHALPRHRRRRHTGLRRHGLRRRHACRTRPRGRATTTATARPTGVTRTRPHRRPLPARPPAQVRRRARARPRHRRRPPPRSRPAPRRPRPSPPTPARPRSPVRATAAPPVWDCSPWWSRPWARSSSSRPAASPLADLTERADHGLLPAQGGDESARVSAWVSVP